MTEQPRVKTRARQGSAGLSQATAWTTPRRTARTTSLSAASAADRGTAQATASALIHGKA